MCSRSIYVALSGISCGKGTSTKFAKCIASCRYSSSWSLEIETLKIEWSPRIRPMSMLDNLQLPWKSHSPTRTSVTSSFAISLLRWGWRIPGRRKIPDQLRSVEGSAVLCASPPSPISSKERPVCLSVEIFQFSHMNHLPKFKQPRVNRMIFSNPLLAIYFYDGIFWGTNLKELYCYKSICLLIECLIQQHWISTQSPQEMAHN